MYKRWFLSVNLETTILGVAVSPAVADTVPTLRIHKGIVG